MDYGCFAPVQAFAEVFRAFGIEPEMEEVRKPMGMLKRDHIKAMLEMPRIRGLWIETYKKPAEEEDIDRLYRLFEGKLMGILENFTDVKPGVLETVKALREKGIPVGSTTGYTDQMMEIVTQKAEEHGYKPDAWFSPDSTHKRGRPYPYMIYRNMEAFAVSCAAGVVKVGDTVSDIKEGKNAGVFSVGIIEGSSEMGLGRDEFERLSAEEKKRRTALVREKYRSAGADAVIGSMQELMPLLESVFLIG